MLSRQCGSPACYIYCYISPQTAFRALLAIKERPGQGARSEGFGPPNLLSVECVARAGDLRSCLLTWRYGTHWYASLACLSQCCKARFRPAETKIMD